ncbi:MAG: ThuA domain-containing protein [Planctomycetes bacterium]|nr:ThuA domain-containing protein [Planctomycetota bacterium]MCG2683265.1 ThuA domain-containing protein [Planctomycetales bacterium]
MKRREMLLTTGAAVLGLPMLSLGQIVESHGRSKPKALYFTRSAGYEHPPVVRKGNEPSASEKLLTEWGRDAGFDVVCSKDGAVFDGDLDQFDCFIFYTSGDLTGKCDSPQPGKAMSAEGKKELLAAIHSGKGFVGIHSATDTFHGEGVDPFIAMLGGEFITHGDQQKASMKVAAPKFPGMEGLGDSFTIHDEWYAQYKFPKDLHVILVQDTEGMKGKMYQRPSYPATWARMHGKGRVFYTSMGHGRIWLNPTFRQVLLGGIAWALGYTEADVKPNIEQVTPGANQAEK